MTQTEFEEVYGVLSPIHNRFVALISAHGASSMSKSDLKVLREQLVKEFDSAYVEQFFYLNTLNEVSRIDIQGSGITFVYEEGN